MQSPQPPEPLYTLPSYTHSAAQGVVLAAVAAAGLDVLVSLTAAASLLARRWGRPPQLGAPWVRFAAYPQRGLLAAAAVAAVACLLGAALALRPRGSQPPPPTPTRDPPPPPARTRRPLASPSPPASRGPLFAAAAPFLLPLTAAACLLALVPVYPPLAFARWSARYGQIPILAPALAAARLHLLAFLAPLLATTLAGATARLGALRETGDSHGSSHWATPREVAATGLLHTAPVPAPAALAALAASTAAAGMPAVVAGAWHGRAPGHLRRRLHHLADARDRHVLAFAPSGSGKSTCLVVPTLLTWTSSVVVLDVKGELWHLTAGYRSQVLGHRCLRLDPGCADGSAAAYNPLLLVPHGPGDVKHAQSVADVLVDPEGRDRPRTFWEHSAHALLTAIVLHVVYSAQDPTLAACAHLLANPGHPLQETLEALLTARHDPALGQGWIDPHTRRATYTHPAVAAAARTLLDLDPRTSSGIVATAQAHLALFRDPILAANTAGSDFTPLDLVIGDRPLSLYLTLAPADLERLRGPVRLFLNQLCRALTERLDFVAHRRPLLLLLDEFTVLGRLDFFGRAMAYLRGYGIRVYLSIQSLAQLHDIYGPHQSITANCPLQIAFAPADLETAELLSRLLGPTTVHLAKRSRSGAPLALGPRRHTLSLHEHARPLLTAEEVRRLPDTDAIVLPAGHPPIRARRVPYYADPDLAQRCRIPPPAAADHLLSSR